MSTTNTIKKLNEIYHIMNKNYTILKKIFHNHNQIRDTIILSENFLQQTYGLILEKLEEVESKRQFNKIVKGIKEK